MGNHPEDFEERSGVMQAAIITEKPRKQAISGRFWAGRTYWGRIKNDHKIDPACGTSGFLVAAGEYLKENKKDEIFYNKVKKDHYMNHMFHGFDMDRTNCLFKCSE